MPTRLLFLLAFHATVHSKPVATGPIVVRPVPSSRLVLDNRVAVRTITRSRPPPGTADMPLRQAPRPEGLLMNKDDVWRSVTHSSNLTGATVSDARLSQRTIGNKMEWEIEAPIPLKYRVRESADVFDVASDELLFGHLDNGMMLTQAMSRPLKRVVVVDQQVYELYGDRIDAYFEHYAVKTKLLVLPTTEENKNMDMVLEIAEAIHELGLDRRLDPVIAIGGGVCMDIVGFAASIYRRRTPYVRVPTTLMGYVDASIGCKTGVNFAGKKNKLGAYMPPALTLLDKTFLGTLDQRQLSNGAAEIAKMALVKDSELFDLLCEHGSDLIHSRFQDGEVAPRVLYLAIQTMLEELAPNLWEDSLERLVDFGHVFSMELEMAELFSNKAYHGEAVAIDMAFSATLAYVRGHLDEATLNDSLLMLRALELPVSHPRFTAELVDVAMYERVKFSSGQKIPLPVGRGVARIFNDITDEELGAALAEWERRTAVMGQNLVASPGASAC